MNFNYKYTIVSIGIITTIIIIVADFLIMPFYVRHGQGSYMVNVKGKQLNYALDILSSEGHKGVVSDTLFSSAFKPGIVIDQYPSTKMKVKEGRTVRLTISNAERSVIVPDLIGRSERSAELDIR